MTTDVDGTGGAQHLVMRAARRRWPVVVAGVVVALVAGGAIAMVLPHRYETSAKVVVNPVPSDTPDQSRPKAAPPVTMGTEAQIARSSVVRDLAGRKYLPAGMDLHVLDSGLVVSVVPDSSVLRFTFTAKRPAVAVAGAQAYAAAYLDNRASTAHTFVGGVIQQLTATVAATQKQIDAANAARDRAPSGSSARQKQNTLLATLNSKLLSTENDLATRQNAQIAPGSEITKPTAAHRSGPQPALVLALAAILGLVIGLSAATLRERTDERLLDPGDIPDDLGVPLLAVLPPHDPDTVIDPDSAAADAYRQLRNEIFLGPRPPVVLAISRVDAATGTGDVTANLAVLLSRSGRRVVVIDTDTGPNRLETLLEGVDRVGLVHASPGEPDLDSGIAVVTQREGVGQARLGDLLASPLFGRLISATRQEAEVVLIDAPPALSSAGQAVLANADATLLVVTRRRTRRSDILTADERIRRAGSRLVGTALRDTERRDAGAGGRRPKTGPAALPPASRPALAGNSATSARSAGQQPMQASGQSSPPGGATYHPDGRITAAATTAAGPLGWPEPRQDGPVAPGTGSDLGWPESGRALP